MAEFIDEKTAAALIKDGQTLAVGGFGAFASPEALLQAIADSYEETGHPADLDIACLVGVGNNSEGPVGLNRIADPGLMRSVIGGHFAFTPLVGQLISENRIEAYSIPLGSIVHLFRAMEAGSSDYITQIGLGTFADPRKEGCKVNEKAKSSSREIVSLTKINGREYLTYRAFPIDVCIIRGTYADEDGNISMDDEPVGDYELEIAGATRASGGIVIVQVKEIIKRGTMHPKKVRIHNSQVDYIVKCTDPVSFHRQCTAGADRPELTGEIFCPTAAIPPMSMSNRKIIARRGVKYLKKGMLINLGIGIPSGIGSVANEEGLSDYLTLSLETGPIGGVPVEGVAFGASVNPEIIHTIAEIFDLYDGGALDMTFLGAAEIDALGNVNVSKFGTRCTGPGGFVNISQRTPRTCFMGTFTAGGLREEVRDGKLVILQEGKNKKFKKNVQQITYSGEYAALNGQDVSYVTERAVFRLTPRGLMLTEIAPGVDLLEDVLGQMEFEPLISDDLRLMDEDIFRDQKMNIIDEFLCETGQKLFQYYP